MSPPELTSAIPTPPSPLDVQHHQNPHSAVPTPTSTHHKHFSFATRSLHVGSEPSLSSSSDVIPELHLSTTYRQSKVGKHKGFEYTRSANPTRLALERLLASLEGADVLLERNLRAEGRADSWEGGPAALAFSSGSAATATVVGGLAGQGGHVVSVADVYGGTSRYMVQVAGTLQGAQTTFVDMSYSGTEPVQGESEEQRRKREDDDIVARVEAAIQPNTKLIWAETPTNPILNLVPIALISRVAKAHSIPLVIDNTFATPYYQNPLLLGADIVVHSLTKYLNGHSDVLGGALITPSPQLLTQFRFLQNAHGAVPAPFDAMLAIRGIKTLSLRARQHGLNALAVARWLQEVAVPAGLVRDVRYPGLNRGEAVETAGQRRERELAWEQLSLDAKASLVKAGFTRDSQGGFPFSGMVSFHINSNAPQSQEDSSAAERFLEGLELFSLAESLGGVESLAELPLKMTHAGVPAERRRELGIDGELVRLSVGVEDGEDLVKDVEQSLRAALQLAK
ncbi:hypothetical protein T439DRAFT_328147 [Meredithblackwellia eburnea MCA 4105]